VRSPIQGETPARGTLREHELWIRFTSPAAFFERRRRTRRRFTDGPALCGCDHRGFGNRRAAFRICRASRSHAGAKPEPARGDAHADADRICRASGSVAFADGKADRDADCDGNRPANTNAFGEAFSLNSEAITEPDPADNRASRYDNAGSDT
jgi:hypothetical protein